VDAATVNGHGRGRGQYYNSSRKSSKSGLYAALGTSVFDYGQKASADQMRTSWEKIVQYVGTNYGQDISNELQNKVTVTLAEPVHSLEVMARHVLREQMIRVGQANIHRAHIAQRTMLEAAVLAGVDLEAPMNLAILNNQIAEE